MVDQHTDDLAAVGASKQRKFLFFGVIPPGSPFARASPEAFCFLAG